MVTKLVVDVPEGQLITIMQGTRAIEIHQLAGDERAVITIDISRAVYSAKEGAT